MKKITMVTTALAMLAGNSAFAQNNNPNDSTNPNTRTGQGARNATVVTDEFAWGPALVGLAIIGVVVGVTAAAATHTPSSFSH